jgi:DNA polymerase-3 subunit delta
MDSIKQKKLEAIYILDGEEPYYLDKLMKLFEENVLAPTEQDFNLSIFYGREVKALDIISACRRFPMFAERQVVLVKDAAAMSDFENLEPYFLKPTPSTLLVVEYRNKKIDTRTKFGKLIKENLVHFCSEKIKEEAIPAWIIQLGKTLGFFIGEKEAEILTLYLGNNLEKIESELEKIRINAPDEKILNGSLIQKYIGINRDYNLFEFPEAFSSGNKEKTYNMLSYFLTNSKSAPMVLVTVSFYTHFIQLYKANFAKKLPEKEWASAVGVNPYYVKNVINKTNRWPLHKVEETLSIIAEYNAKCVGINSNESDGELLKEMMGKLMLLES